MGLCQEPGDLGMTVTDSVEGRNWGGASEDKALSQSVLDTHTPKFSAPPNFFMGGKFIFWRS